MDDIDQSSGWFLNRLFHTEFKKICIPLNGRIEIGRNVNRSCISLDASTFQHVSRKHCVLRFNEGRAIIQDEFSAGGTYVNGRKLSMAQPGELILSEGDLIGIGTHTNDTVAFYKKNSHVLFYRVCKVQKAEDVVTISDDDEDDEANEQEVKDVTLPSNDDWVFESQPPTSNCGDQVDDDVDVKIPISMWHSLGESISIDSDDYEENPVASTSKISIDSDDYEENPVASTSRISNTGSAFPGVPVVSIPGHVFLNHYPRCSWEEEFDLMRSVKQEYHPDSQVESSTMCVSDDETDPHFSQVAWEEIKQESCTVEDYVEYQPAVLTANKLLDNEDEENSTNSFYQQLIKDRKQQFLVTEKQTFKATEARVLQDDAPVASTSKTVPKSHINSNFDVIENQKYAVTEENSEEIRKSSGIKAGFDASLHTTVPVVDPVPTVTDKQSGKPNSFPKRRLSLIDIDLFKPPPKERGSTKSTPSIWTKGIAKRRASISEVDAICKKKLKRRFSVSDRPVVTRPEKSANALSQKLKQTRRALLQEAAVKSKIKPPSGSIEQPKANFTKPRVKLTTVNRGAYLTTPIDTRPKPLPPSRPLIEEYIVCTQSTTLDQLDAAVADDETIIHTRPGKMTFKSVEKLSTIKIPATHKAVEDPSALCLATTRPSAPGSHSGNFKIPLRRASTSERTFNGVEKLSTIKIPATHKSVEDSSALCPATIRPGAPGSHSSSSKMPLRRASTSERTSLSSSAFTTRSYMIKQTGMNTTEASLMERTQNAQFPKNKETVNTLKGILKNPSGSSDKHTPKRNVAFKEENDNFIVSRHLPQLTAPDPRMVQAELRRKEWEVVSEIVSWRVEWLAEKNGGPFEKEQMMSPILQNYPNLKAFQEVLHPIIKRELWHDVRSRYLSKQKRPLPSIELRNVTTQEIQCQLCQISCIAFISSNEKQSLKLNNFGVLEYGSTQNRIFAYIITHKRTAPPEWNGEPPTTRDGEWFNLTVYVPLRSKEELRRCSRLLFRPITAIMLHLRFVKAIQMLAFSPLESNILSPANSKVMMVGPEHAFRERPDLRDFFGSGIGPGALNKTQVAVMFSVLAECSRWTEPSISLIQGPPGTGKSRVIAQLALALMYLEPQKVAVKVLVCAQSNTAVDVIAKRLISLQKDMDPENQYNLLRFGAREKVDPLCLDIFFDEQVKRQMDEKLSNDLTIKQKFRQSLQDELVSLDEKIRKLREDPSKDRDTNRSRLEDCYKRQQQLNKCLSENMTNDLHPDERYKEEISARKTIVKKAYITCTTLGSCTNLASFSDNVAYDVCIIDEATQCTEVCSLLPLLYGMSKLVLVGDINQLPATVLDQESVTAGFRRSLFSRLHDVRPDAVKMLNVQYRMDPEICRWPNMYFYKGKLKNDPSTPNYKRSSKCFPRWPYLVVSLCFNQELTQVHHEIYNRDEILFVAELLKNIVKCCQKNWSIAVITPYQRHKEELLGHLRESNLKQVQVHSIDSVQGKEYDVVIISLARSNGAGFLKSPERINVALTRARRCLVLCGNFADLRPEPVWESLLQDAEDRGLYHHLEDVAIEDGVDVVMQRLHTDHSDVRSYCKLPKRS